MTDSKDMTIRDVRVTVLRMPWANPAWIKGHALGPDRGILIVDVETAGGITGMGYLFHFRPGLRACIFCCYLQGARVGFRIRTPDRIGTPVVNPGREPS